MVRKISLVTYLKFGMARAPKLMQGVKVGIEAIGITTRPKMEKLLVVVTARDPIEKLLPCLEILARPGMSVIFLFQYPVDSRSYFLDHRITVESARHATAMGRKIADRYNWEAQKELAQQIIAPALGALQNQGVQVVTHLRSGSLAKIIKNYSADQDIHWIITQFPRLGLLGYLSVKSVVPFGWSSYLLSVRSDPELCRKATAARTYCTKDWHAWLNQALCRWTTGALLRWAISGQRVLGGW
jgi:hypothetical protein